MEASAPAVPWEEFQPSRQHLMPGSIEQTTGGSLGEQQASGNGGEEALEMDRMCMQRNWEQRAEGK